MKEMDFSLVAKAKGISVEELKRQIRKKTESDSTYDDQSGVQILSTNSFSAPRVVRQRSEIKANLFTPKRKLPGFMFQKSGDENEE